MVGLVERAQDGDHAAFALKTPSKWPTSKPGAGYGTSGIRIGSSVWLYRLLVNACYEESRRHRRWDSHVRTLPVDGPSVADPTIAVDDRDALDRAFEHLTPQHRVVVVLHHYVGLPLTTIADISDVPVGTVKSRLHYALRILRAALTAADEPERREVRPA